MNYKQIRTFAAARELPSGTAEIKQMPRRFPIFLAGALLSTVALAQSGKIAPDLTHGGHGATVDVIVQYKDAASETDHALVMAKGGVLRRRLDVIHAAHYSVPVDS